MGLEMDAADAQPFRFKLPRPSSLLIDGLASERMR